MENFDTVKYKNVTALTSGAQYLLTGFQIQMEIIFMDTKKK